MEINELLKIAVAEGASDIHLAVGTPPAFRLSGNLTRWAPGGEPHPNLSQQDTLQAAQTLMSSEQFQLWQQRGELDFSYAIPGVGRFRVNAYRQRGCISIALRPVPFKIPPLESLGIPQTVTSLADKANGLVLVTGPTGSGKSTTLAALINKINQERSCHIITIEDPIEYLYQHQKSVVDQREVGSDTPALNGALRACLRQDPDVILVGELRDPETISTAVTAAETGHLVFAALHTNSAAQTIDRIIDIFPRGQQEHIKVQLSTTLQGVVTQQLLPHASGKGRVLAAEIMIVNPAIRNLIREGKSHQIPTVLQTGTRFGMQSMDMALRDLVKAGKVTTETALKYCSDPDNLSRMVNSIL